MMNKLRIILAVCILGFSLGDELGFKDSLSNVEGNRRRAAQASPFTVQATKFTQNSNQLRRSNLNSSSQDVSRRQNEDQNVPPFKPIPPAPERPQINPQINRKNVTISDRMSNNGIENDDLSNVDMASENLVETPKPRRTTTISPPIIKNMTSANKPNQIRKHSTTGKVMNAPREYYPVGYDKNFDDNFSSRVDLPETSFHCGNQKHFPGLYADEDLGCMVFHVCALTDDGLIMKSFLCPESTLFDQTILKCNWWFYVDCKNSKKLYDSNIPISKSYQLMKALTFFSAYKKDTAKSDVER
ncbi:uncharacterized protein [Onthophagus taurus]|uniref:uncharacterized protein isoform X2 n=1 Tax=Onthophagus taurus TaxID=166361 RepID=UPI000C2056D4|nr:uncharacterized protein LOC111414536 isoform X2 [Onthophagus taurus]